MPIPALPLFKHRDTVVTPADQNQFVTQFETTMDTMSNDVIPAINLSINDMNTQYNNIYNNLPFAPDSGYSQAYIDTNIYKKTEIDEITIINNFIDKPMPVDTDNLALQETGGLLKKLSFANLRTWILSLFNPSLTGTVSFNSTTNSISLTGIVTVLGLEIGDVIKINGATDSKNNSEFTVEVITDANNIIVNQAHANKGTTKNVANRASDNGVTVKLLSKWHNAPMGLGQDFVSLTESRTTGVTYPNNTKRALFCVYGASSGGSGVLGGSNVSGFSIPNIGQVSTGGDSFSYLIVPNNGTYSRASGNLINLWLELR